MQGLLTEAAIAVELLGFGYFASSFALYTHQHAQQARRWKRSLGASLSKQPPAEPISPPKRKLSPVEQLRQDCQKAGIKWRHAHGKNKHLKKAEMIEALRQMERSKKKAVSLIPPPNIEPRKVA
jgi:hypothetical protein